MARHHDFTTIRTEGALLPPDLLRRLRDNDKDLPGLTPDAYHLIGHTRLSEAISEAWNKLQGAWATFQDARTTIPQGTPGTATTRDRWLLPLFQVLDYGRLQTSTAREVSGKTYPISHAWTHVPIHLVGCNIDLDTRTAGVAGAARQSPHGLVQAYLNATDDSLWGIVSNGLKLRLLRDNHTLTRQAYLEFDLEAMLTGEVYPDFVLLYLTLHQSRLEADKPENTLLEQWTRAAQDQGTRALDRLRDGVQAALTTLGQGFLEHPANTTLRTDLTTGTLTPQDYYRQLLRVVYRFLVLFAAEDRDLLHPPTASEDAKRRYTYYSTRRLRDLADAIPGGRHPDQYYLLKRTWHWLGHDGAPDLAIPALGGFLFSDTATPHLDDAELTNRSLLTAIRHLAYTQVNHTRYPIDYKNLGAEELGSVYESLLELQPRLDPDTSTFTLETLSGNERKTTGSYYTPTSLITLLLDSALDPVLDEATRKDDPEKAILELKVVDPASGSGHFLIAAAHRIARRLGQVRTGDDEPTPQATRAALRDTITHCIYGVDLNDMAAELCKVGLWLEAIVPGAPLTFLDHHIKVGNSIVGAPTDMSVGELARVGIPDEAYRVFGDDDRVTAGAAKRHNGQVRGGQQLLFPTDNHDPSAQLFQQLSSVDSAPDSDIRAARAKDAAYRAVVQGEAHTQSQTLANLWTGAFLWPKQANAPAPITTGDLHAVLAGHSLSPTRTEMGNDLHRVHRFFNWNIEFAEVFGRPNPGFDVVVGNPPFLNQLEEHSVTSPRVANLIGFRLGGAKGTYTDVSAQFLALAVSICRRDGHVTMVQPQSVLAARDGGPVRKWILSRARPTFLWVAQSKVFDANVLVAGITLRIQTLAEWSVARAIGSPSVALGRLDVTFDELARLDTWSPLISEAFGGVRSGVVSGQELGDRFEVAADFRDQYYGLIPYVYEGRDPKEVGDPPLITSGLIDPAHCLWGETTTRFAKQKWQHPRVSLPSLSNETKLATWAKARLRPKVLVATQTRVLEAVLDREGSLLPSVPVISIFADASELPLIAAVMNSPPVNAWAVEKYGGTAMATQAIKLSAAQIRTIPLPQNQRAWERGGAAFENASMAEDVDNRLAHLEESAMHMCEAYNVGEELVEWWLERMRPKAD